MSKYEDDFGTVLMVCNSCGEETSNYECCDDGEVEHYEDCDCEECA